MEKQNKGKPTVEFKNTKIVNDTIQALVGHFTGKTLGEFILEKALEGVENNNKKLKQYKEDLLTEGDEE